MRKKKGRAGRHVIINAHNKKPSWLFRKAFYKRE